MAFKQITALILFLATQVYAQQANSTNLVCYDCDPQNNAEQCLDPVQNGVQQINCGQKFPDRNPNSTLICLSANLTFTGNSRNNTGIYRGCQLQEASVENFCDWFREETNNQNAILVSCVPCNTTRCNSITFNVETGEPNKANTLFNFAFTFVITTFIFTTLF